MDIAVLEGDALAVAADVLVLERSQGLHGVVTLVVNRLGSHAGGIFPKVPLAKELLELDGAAPP
jgi:hypothetical protein